MGWVSEEECAKMAYSEQRDVVVMELMNAFPHTDAQLLKEVRGRRGTKEGSVASCLMQSTTNESGQDGVHFPSS